MTYSIRLATPDDIPHCVELLDELFSIEEDFSPDAERQTKGLLSILASPTSRLLVAVANKAANGEKADTCQCTRSELETAPDSTCETTPSIAQGVPLQSVVGMASGQLTISTAQGSYSVLVEDVAVHQTYRRCGIGTHLLHHLEQWGKRHGATRMQLLADIENIPALHFYKSRQWEQTQLVNIRKYIA